MPLCGLHLLLAVDHGPDIGSYDLGLQAADAIVFLDL
jgi:hypothetical protein